MSKPRRRLPEPESAESGLVLIPLRDLREAPENDDLYRPVDMDDPEIVKLGESIAQHGVLEPLVVTRDHYILSGHRRFAAAHLADRYSVPCRYEEISRAAEPERFLVLLREYNRQREKSLDEKLRESIVSADPADAYAVLVEERKRKSIIDVEPLVLPGYKARAAISDAKRPFLDAILKILKDFRAYWPMSERQIHYNLLNDPPLRHASKPDSVYRNDHNSTRDLSDLCTRARIAGLINENAIGDETRPETIWAVDRNVGVFMDRQIEQFLKGYWRDPMQSQPNHVEILVEKNTIENVLRDVAAEFAIPIQSARGFASLPPRIKIKNRFKRSGKHKLIIILVSDFDPSGEWIADSFARSMRDDFRLDVHPIKAALTLEQIRTIRNLPRSVDKGTKGGDDNKHLPAFIRKYGRRQAWYELEAVPPDVLQALVRKAIESVINIELFNMEGATMKDEADHLMRVRKGLGKLLKKLPREDRD